MMSRQELVTGLLVENPESDLGIGRLGAIDGLLGTVEYFDHPGTGGIIRWQMPLRDLGRATLAPQTRVHARLDGEWRHGRVLEHQADVARALVRLEGREERVLHESLISVRWRRRLADATDLLAAISIESRRFHDGRSSFVRAYLERYAAFQGLTALSSASIELHPHQLEAVRRVLADETQRYLLADEVGLGKTIEAAVLIRQHLLDGPKGTVIVVVPPALRSQWTSELDGKFRIAEQFPARVRVLPFDWLDEPSQGDASLIVVDEAHRIAAEATASPGARRRFETLSEVSRAAEKLILLSATPLLQEPESLLRMLHLLSPSAHPLDDLAGFVRALEARDSIGTLYANLHVEVQPAFLRAAVDGLREVLAGDDSALATLDDVEAALNDGGADVLNSAVRRAQAYIGEGHRLYSRMIRTRRASGLAEEFPVLGRLAPTRIDVGSAPDIAAALDSWREHLAVCLAGESHTWAGLLTAARDIVEASSAAGDGLGDAARRRLEARGPDAPDGSEGELLADLARASARRAATCPRIDQAVVIAVAAAREGDRVAIAAGTEAVADRITAMIQASDSRAPVLRISVADPDAGPRFAAAPDGAILVFGPAGEEGQNLQAADVVVHVDLPWNPNRIEQRLGRFDRFGAGVPARQIVIVEEGSLGDAWLDVLESGFGIFSGSIASLQLVIDGLLPGLVQSAIEGGPAGLAAAAPAVASALNEELERIELAELIDETAVNDSGLKLIEATEIAEGPDGAKRWAASVVRWAAGDGSEASNLRFHHAAEGNQHHFALTPHKRPNVERLELRDLPLIPLDELQRRFAGSLDAHGVAGGTFRRLTAARREIRLLGPGDPLVEALWAFTEEDDRGRAFATWRCRNAWRGRDELLAFCFDFRISADVGAAAALLGSAEGASTRAALHRRAQAYLPAFVERVWLDPSGVEIADLTVRARLDEPFSELRGDVTLRPWLWHRVDDFVTRGVWQETCRRVRDRGLEVVSARRELVETCARAATQFLEDGKDAAARTHARRDRDSAERAARGLAISEALAAGVATPLVEVDAAGIVVLAGEPIPRDELS